MAEDEQRRKELVFNKYPPGSVDPDGGVHCCEKGHGGGSRCCNSCGSKKNHQCNHDHHGHHGENMERILLIPGVPVMILGYILVMIIWQIAVIMVPRRLGLMKVSTGPVIQLV